MRQGLFLVAVAGVVMILIVVSTYYTLRARRSSRNAWMILMQRLRPINRELFTAVALDLLEEGDPEQRLDPDLIFDMIGGLNGLDALNQNCDVLIDLATYVQKWYPDALQLAEELRLSAREIKWHIGRLRAASENGHLRDQFPTYAQQAVATYYLMTRSLLVLYEGVQLPEFVDLQRAI